MVMINMRVSKKDKAELAGAAKSVGMSLSAFLRSAAVTHAHRILGPPRLVSSKPEYSLRGGPGLDYPCAHPSMIECADSTCQAEGRCKAYPPTNGDL